MEKSSPWHTRGIDDAFRDLESGPQGLSSAEAARRLEQYGPNEIAAAERVAPWKLFLGQFKNTLILILLAATALSAFIGEPVEAATIAVIVLFAVILGFVQEFRAERAIEALKQMAAPTAMAMRDGELTRVAARELVPGDVIALSPGDRCPADGRLIEAVNLTVDEAMLTGESLPVEKITAALSGDDLPAADRRNLVYAGTAPTYGRGRALVVATGGSTEFGRIAGMLASIQPGKTSLEAALDRVGAGLSRAAFVIILMILAAGLIRAGRIPTGDELTQMILFGVALAVAVVPEALPAVVTISLALGVRRMAKRHALVRRLPSVEELGSVSVICSDKTGTLTKDEMTVRRIWVAGRELDVAGSGYVPQGEISPRNGATVPKAALDDLLTAAVLASDARLRPQQGDEKGREWRLTGDPTEGALVVAAAKAGLQKDDLDGRFPRVDEIPFTAETRRMITLHEGSEGAFLCAKGAPEELLALCTRWRTETGIAPLDEGTRAHILEAAKEMAHQALRVLAVAERRPGDIATAERELTFLGLAGMIDPPRPEVAEAIRTCEKAGIRAVMITGDHPATAAAIARELGLLTDGRVVTGVELEALSEEALDREVEQIQVYARVSPAHKLRVVSAWQKQGHRVAMTGDGVNDAPALKKADIGVAMGLTGTDVSREAAAMTLTDDNFASIVAAIEEGRNVFGNIKKYLMYLLSANIGEIGLMMVATIFGMPLPLTAVQILYVNLATDGLPALALAVDPPEPDLMKRPPRDPRAKLFTRSVLSLMLLGGIWSTLINTGLFAWGLANGGTPEHGRTLIFLTLVMIEFFKAYSFRSDRLSAFVRPFANKWLNLAILWELALVVLILAVPALSKLFELQDMSVREIILCCTLAATVVPVLEAGKLVLRWRARAEHRRARAAGR